MTNKWTRILLAVSLLMISMAFGITAFAQPYAAACHGISDCRAVSCIGSYCRSWADPGECNGYCHCENPDINQGVGVCDPTN